MGYKPAITQDSLRHLWHCGQEGRLSAWQVAKALGLREASKELHGDIGNLPWIAARLVKIGGGIPTPQSLHELFAKIEVVAATALSLDMQNGSIRERAVS